MKKIKLTLLFCFLILLIFISNINLLGSIITTLNKNDPAPIYSSAYPYNYLYQHEKEYLKQRTNYDDYQTFSIAFSPFYQRASCGTNINQKRAQLGDLTGRWNMIAVLPQGQFNRATNEFVPRDNQCFFDRQKAIAQNLFSCINMIFTDSNKPLDEQQPVPEELLSTAGLLSLQRFPEQFFGFFSVPIKYRKIGVRFDASIRICNDVGISFQTGVADISQTARYLDQTTTPTQCIPSPCFSTCPTTTQPPIACLNPFASCKVKDDQWRCVVDCVHTELMNKLSVIAKETGNDLCNFNKTSIEDVHVEAWWRHAYDITPNYVDGCWSPFYFVPFLAVGASFPTGETRNQNQPLSLPFGNNGHFAFRLNAGFALDFFDTIELGMHSGVTHFFPKKFDNYRVPNNCFQNGIGIIPFVTNVKVQPGQTWHVGLIMNAYRFLNCFSSHVEYLYVSHIRDKITLRNACDTKCSDNQPKISDGPHTKVSPFNSCIDSPPTCNIENFFKPDALECVSPWNAHLLNASLNLDVSPNFTIGGIIQIPLAQRNAYKSTTYMVSCVITY